MTGKRCTHCGEYLPVSCFGFNRKGSKLESWCNDCHIQSRGAPDPAVHSRASYWPRKGDVRDAVDSFLPGPGLVAVSLEDARLSWGG